MSKTATGWMMWHSGKPHSLVLDRTKEDLLIGYDIIPLRGLDATEQFLASRGKVARLTQAAITDEGQHHCYAVTLRGELVPEMLAHSVCAATRLGAMRAAAGYLARRCQVSEADCADLRAYWLWLERLQGDKRRRATLAKLQARIESIFKREGVDVCCLAFQALNAPLLKEDR